MHAILFIYFIFSIPLDILNGYDDLMRISEQVASYLFAFENDFLRKFSLTWKLLCQRLYQQHVHLHLADTMLACIITVTIQLNFKSRNK